MEKLSGWFTMFDFFFVSSFFKLMWHIIDTLQQLYRTNLCGTVESSVVYCNLSLTDLAKTATTTSNHFFIEFIVTYLILGLKKR